MTTSEEKVAGNADWSQTPAGNVETWLHLQTVLGLRLASRLPLLEAAVMRLIASFTAARED
ncbi:MAG TPA: hypothetical protein V6D11_10835 [Waterburya sp.]